MFTSIRKTHLLVSLLLLGTCIGWIGQAQAVTLGPGRASYVREIYTRYYDHCRVGGKPGYRLHHTTFAVTANVTGSATRLVWDEFPDSSTDGVGLIVLGPTKAKGLWRGWGKTVSFHNRPCEKLRSGNRGLPPNGASYINGGDAAMSVYWGTWRKVQRHMQWTDIYTNVWR